MDSSKKSSPNPPDDDRAMRSWRHALVSLEQWHGRGRRPVNTGPLGQAADDPHVSFLLGAAWRSWITTDALLPEAARRAPRGRLDLILHLAMGELIHGDGAIEAIGDHTVRFTRSLLSAREAGFVNAVLRRLRQRSGEVRSAHASVLAQPASVTLGEPLAGLSPAVLLGHPDWLVKRWEQAFGSEATVRLMAWNQRPRPVYVRLHPGEQAGSAVEGATTATRWDGYRELKPDGWPVVAPDLAAGRADVQDPAQGIPPRLLGIRPGEAVLDLCAAPGGKSRRIAEFLAGDPESRLVVLDRPGPRIEQLAEAISHFGELNVGMVERDLLETDPEQFRNHRLPAEFDAVLIDVPCSNTGVIARKPEVRLRLKRGEFERLANRQLALLRAASHFVKPGGRLVYSTCSLEKEENADLVGRFLDTNEGAGFFQKGERMSLPWRDETDGGGAFLLVRRG